MCKSKLQYKDYSIKIKTSLTILTKVPIINTNEGVFPYFSYYWYSFTVVKADADSIKHINNIGVLINNQREWNNANTSILEGQPKGY